MVKNKDTRILFLLLTQLLQVIFRNIGLIFAEPPASAELPI